MYFNLALRVITLSFSSLVLIGCMVGPDFHSPHSPDVKSYTKTPLPKKTVSIKSAGKAGKAQHFTTAKSMLSEWWRLFHSPELNKLIHRGIAHSPSLASAQATLRAAQETLNAEVGNLMFPAVNAQIGGERQQFSDSSIGGGDNTTIFNLFNTQVNVSYTLDVFGGSRRQIEAMQAQVDYQRYVLVGTYLTLTSNIATTAITTASLRAQVRATERLIRDQANQLRIIEKQLHLGGASGETVLSQQTLLAKTRALLPPLQKSLAQSEHALAVLIGSFPGEADLPEIDLNKLNLPADLPVSLPSELVRQRPDIQASEALLHQASANVGVATANLLPQITLNANYGWAAVVPNQLFGATSKVWAWGGQLTQPIFRGGALLAQRRAAIASFQAACAQYKQTVLQSFQNVADSLQAIQDDARALRAQKQAEIAAQGSLDLARKQYKVGGVSYLTLLDAQQKYQETLINRIQAQAARYTDTVALFQSLGGGWWNRKQNHAC